MSDRQMEERRERGKRERVTNKEMVRESECLQISHSSSTGF